MAEYKCCACNKGCEVMERDDGGYEEVWGAKTWVSAWTDYSDCCGEEVEKIEEFEDEIEIFIDDVTGAPAGAPLARK